MSMWKTHSPWSLEARKTLSFFFLSWQNAGSHPKWKPTHLKPFRQPTWLHRAWLISKDISMPGHTLIWGKKRPHADLSALPCQCGSWALSTAATVMTCQVLRWRPTKISSAEPNSSRLGTERFFRGWEASPDDELPDADESVPEELDEPELSSSGESTVMEQSASSCMEPNALNLKNCQSMGGKSFLNCSKANWGSARGNWPPLANGVAGRQFCCMRWIKAFWSLRLPIMSSLEYSWTLVWDALCLPWRRLSSSGKLAWAAHDSSVVLRPWTE